MQSSEGGDVDEILECANVKALRRNNTTDDRKLADPEETEEDETMLVVD